MARPLFPAQLSRRPIERQCPICGVSVHLLGTAGLPGDHQLLGSGSTYPATTSPAVTRSAYLPPALATWPDTRRRSMQVIPAIDLLDGQCVRLHQGDYDQVTRFSDDPVAQALSWQQQGAQRLHLVDLDGARTGQPVNDPVLKAITAALNIPVQLGGGVRSAARAKDLLACGLDRVILGTVALELPELVDQLAADHPGQIVVGIDARDGKVATRGWLEASGTEATVLAKRFGASGIAAIISTDIATDGTLAGPNLAALRAMAMASSVPVIASGGIGNLEHLLSLLALEPLGVEGVIVGRALYDGRVDLAEALQAIGSARLQDPLLGTSAFA